MESNYPNYQQTKNFFPVFMAIATLSVSLMFYGLMDFGMNSSQITTQSTSNVLGATTSLQMATLKVVNNSNMKTYKNITFEDGETAYEFLLNAKEQTNFDFEGNLYDFGYYIHTINGRRALNNEYWKFVINGDDSITRMEDYELKDGDIIEFELEQF